MVEGPCMATQLDGRVSFASDKQMGHQRPSGNHGVHQHMTQQGRHRNRDGIVRIIPMWALKRVVLYSQSVQAAGMNLQTHVRDAPILWGVLAEFFWMRDSFPV